MCHAFLREASFWSFLLEIDRDIAEEARKGRCRRCGGPLHSAHFRRKPRGVEVEAFSVELCYRLSLCCGREGCRKRLTPPSVRFLGRAVYLGAVVVLVTAMCQGPTPRGKRQLRNLFGADVRTIARWQRFWQEIFPRSRFWSVERGRFMPPADERLLPKSILDRTAGSSLPEKLRATLLFLSPITIPGGFSMQGF